MAPAFGPSCAGHLDLESTTPLRISHEEYHFALQADSGALSLLRLRPMAHRPILQRNPDIVYRQIDGGGVLLNIKSGAYHEINSTAREIWDALETPSTESEVLERLVKRFGDVQDLDSDVSEFIGMLTERNLVLVNTDTPDQE